MDQNEWMGKCVPHFISKGKGQDQAVAACISMWESGDTKLEEMPVKKSKSRLEILAEFKKVCEKNGWQIAEEKLEGLLLELQELPGEAQMSLSKVEIDFNNNPQLIKIFPKKKVYVEKYDYVFDFNDIFFDEIIRNFENDKLFRPFGDEQHQLGEKFFDINRLYKQEDGLYAEIKLTDLGYHAIKDRKYSYISPQWGKRTDTEGNTYQNVLMAVTLTNIPALEGVLPTLQEQMKLDKTEEVKMDANLTKKLFELTGKADGFKLAMELPPEVVTMLQEIVGMVDELKAKLDEAVAGKAAAEEQIKQIEDAQEQAAMETFFDDAVKLGKLEPCELDDMKKLWAMDKETVRKVVDARKESAVKEGKLSANQVTYEGYSLTTEDLKIMSERKLDKNNPAHVKLFVEANK